MKLYVDQNDPFSINAEAPGNFLIIAKCTSNQYPAMIVERYNAYNSHLAEIKALREALEKMKSYAGLLEGSYWSAAEDMRDIIIKALAESEERKSDD